MELVKVKVMKKHYVTTNQKKAEAIIIMTKQIPKQKKKKKKVYQQQRNFLKKIISVEICNKFKFAWIYIRKNMPIIKRSETPVFQKHVTQKS